MRLKIIKIGDSKGVIIPKPLLEQYAKDNEIDVCFGNEPQRITDMKNIEELITVRFDEIKELISRATNRY